LQRAPADFGSRVKLAIRNEVSSFAIRTCGGRPSSRRLISKIRLAIDASNLGLKQKWRVCLCVNVDHPNGTLHTLRSGDLSAAILEMNPAISM